MMTIEQFCDRHGVCKDGKDWALANCISLDDVWRAAKPEWLIWIATRKGILDEPTARRFVVVRAVARAAAVDAAWAAAVAAARDTVGDAAVAMQAEWLRSYATPCWEEAQP